MLHFIEDDYNNAFRVWKEGNPGDVFHMLPYASNPQEAKEAIQHLCEYYPKDLSYGDPEETEQAAE